MKKIPLQTITSEDVPERAVRKFVRLIAQEDGTTFAVAMRGYEAMVAYVNRTMKLESDDKLLRLDPQMIARRVMEARDTFGYSLGRTVRAIDTDVVEQVKPDPSPKRHCQKAGCRRTTHESSYRFCQVHIPQNVPSDDGDGVYCLPPPRAVGRMVKDGQKKAAQNELAESEEMLDAG